MSVDTATVKRVAHLARIAVSDEEAERMTGELNAILGFVEQLGEVDVSGVEPMTSVIPMEMRKREEAASAEHASKSDIGWGHQIRSYVLQPYQMVKDLRTGVTSPTPSDVLDGDLDPFMAAALAQRVTGEKIAVEDVD